MSRDQDESTDDQQQAAPPEGVSPVVPEQSPDRSDESIDSPPGLEDQPPPPREGSDLPRFADEYGTVVDAISAGADPEGGDPINEVLESEAGDNTLLSFPAGEYRMQPATLSGHDNVAIAAAAADERPTFFSDPGSFEGRDRFLIFEEISNLLIDGIDFDFCRGEDGGKLTVRAQNNLTIRDVEIRASCASHLQALGISVRDGDGSGLVENFRAVNEGDSEGLTAVYVPPEHAGELTFRECEIRGFSDNGLYASAPGLSEGKGGTVHVERGSYGNNNVSNIRVGTPGSTVQNATVVVDEAPPTTPVNVRGIRFRRGHDQVVEDCVIRYTESAGDSFGALVFHPDNAGATVRNTMITVDRDGVPGIYSPYNSTNRESSQVFENVTIQGSAAEGYFAEFVGRTGVVFRDCTIEGTGENRHGVRFANKNGCRIVDSRIDVTGVPVVVDDGEAEIENTTIVREDDEQHIESRTISNEAIVP